MIQAPAFKFDRQAIYLAFNKPYKVLSQFSQPENSDKRTLSEFNFPKNVYPIGRLDYDSEGLLLLSNDGRLNKSLLSPELEHARTYLAQVENIPSETTLQKLRLGLDLKDFHTKPCGAKLLEVAPLIGERSEPIRYRANIPTAWLELTLTEGKNRQVRRMTAHVGHPTLRLIRAAIGELYLNKLRLQPGEWTELDENLLRLAFI